MHLLALAHWLGLTNLSAEQIEQYSYLNVERRRGRESQSLHSREMHASSYPPGPLRFLHNFGLVMGDLTLGLVYVFLLGPVAIFVRIYADPLRRRRPEGSAFQPWHGNADSLVGARRQW